MFGLSEDIEFPKSESAYRKKPFHVNLPRIPESLLNGDEDQDDVKAQGTQDTNMTNRQDHLMTNRQDHLRLDSSDSEASSDSDAYTKAVDDFINNYGKLKADDAISTPCHQERSGKGRIKRRYSYSSQRQAITSRDTRTHSHLS